MITTRKGRSGEFSYTYSLRQSTSRPISFVDVLTGDEMRTYFMSNGSSDEKSRLGNENTDWQREIYENASTNNQTFSASGGLGGIP